MEGYLKNQRLYFIANQIGFRYGVGLLGQYSELNLNQYSVGSLFVLSAARRLVLIFVNPL